MRSGFSIPTILHMSLHWSLGFLVFYTTPLRDDIVSLGRCFISNLWKYCASGWLVLDTSLFSPPLPDN